MKNPLLVALLAAALILAGVFLALNDYIYQEKQGDGMPVAPYRATLSGTYVCLPHTDTTGPQTMECALGLQTDVGEYYGIDWNLDRSVMGDTPPNIMTGQRFTASGTITPVEGLSPNTWEKYSIAGVFSITDSLKIEAVPDVLPPEPEPVAKCFVGGCSSQLCTDRPDMASTCEYRAEYACYQGATCERQSNGQCGWTQTETLTQCLRNPPPL